MSQEKHILITNYITIAFILKTNSYISKHISIVLQFIITLYPLLITLESQNFQNLKQNWIYQFLILIFRPDLIISNTHMYLISLTIFILHKLFWALLFYNYVKQQTQDRFIKFIRKNLLLKFSSFIFTFYQKLISTYIFMLLSLFCMTSLKIQIQLLEKEKIMFIHIIINFITILMLLLESLFTLYYFDQSITHQVKDIERTRLTKPRVIYQMFIIFQIYQVILVNFVYIEYIQSLLVLISEMTLIYDQFKYFTLNLTYQQKSTFLAISINIAFHLHVLIFPQQILNQILLPHFIFGSLTFYIINNYNNYLNSLQLKSLFKTEFISTWQMKYSLIKLINNDLDSKQSEIIIKSLIATDHRSNCNDIKCFYCCHSQIIFPTQTCGITLQIYREFTMKKMKQFMHLFKLNSKQEQEHQMLLQYAFMLYDFGLIMRSVKLLFYLNYTSKNNENIKVNSFSFSRDQISQINNFDLSTMNQTFLQDCLEQNNTFVQMLSVYNLKFTYLDNLKLSFIFNQAKSKINASLGTSLHAAQKSFISDYIEQNIELDIIMSQKEKLIFDLIEKKLDFYQKIVQTTMINDQISVLHNKVYNLCQNLYELEKQLALAYKHKPCFKLHRIVCFFYGEVLCDYKKAINFFRNSDFFEAQKLQFQQIKNFNINSQNVHYLILEVKDDMETLKIQQFSNKFFNTFGGKSITEEHQFNDLLPKYLVQHHSNLVKKFFETGEAKYYQMFDINYIKNKNELLTPINLCFIITNKFINQNITFASFLQEASQDQVYILVDGVSLRCTFTQNLLTLIGWFESDIEALCKQEKFEDLQITRIYPNFVRFIRSNKIKYSKLNQSILILPKPQNNIQTKNSILPGETQLFLNYVHTECDLVITKNKIANYEYFIINVVKIAEHQQTQVSLKRISINKPKFQDQSKYLVDQTDKSEIEKINAINLNSQTIPESIANMKIQSCNSINKKLSINNNIIMPIQFSRQQTIVNNNQQLFFAENGAVEHQEQVFAASNKIDDKLMRRRKIKKTTIQSETYLDNTSVNKKYQLIQSILGVKSPKHLQKFFFLVVLWHTIFMLFIILFYISFRRDITNVKFQMEMLTFHAAIMAPHDLFFSMRVTITAYQQMQREGFIPKDRLQELTEPYYQYIDIGFLELKDSFYEQFNNEYLQEFLNDQNITMYFMEDNETQIYPINLSFRDALFVILQYQFSQMMTFQYRESTSGKPFQISLFANYFKLHNQCENITNDISQYSIENKNYVQNKQQIILLIGYFIVSLLYIIIQCYQINYFIQIDMLFFLLNTISYEMIESEIDKLTGYKNQYKLDRHCLQQYDPINRSCDYLIKPNKFQEQKYLKLHLGSFNNQKLLNYLLLICLFIFISILFLFTFITTYLYLIKYNDTLYLFQKIQDFKLRTGNLYLYREILFRWNNFTFLNDQDKIQLYTLIDSAQQSIQNYIQISDTMRFDQFLVDDDFIQLFLSISKENLCQFIDKNFQNLTSKYCELAFDGMLKQGMISTLTYLSNSFKTQQTINNFTKRVEINYYEQESSQIVTRVFFALSEQLSQSADSKANFTNTVIEYLCICYFCYIVIILFLFYCFYHPYLAWLFQSLKRIVHLIPFEALIFSDSLEIQLKELIYRLQLL